MPILKNIRHELFVHELIKGRSHRDAYRLAGYAGHKGHGARLARQPDVSQRYDELAKAVVSRTEVTAASIMKELAAIAFANIADFVTIDADGKPQTDLAKLTRDQAAPLVEVSSNEHRVRFKLADKLEALVTLGRMLGMFRERFEPSGAHGGPAQTEPLSHFEAAKRIAFIFTSAEHEARAAAKESGATPPPSFAETGLDSAIAYFTKDDGPAER